MTAKTETVRLQAEVQMNITMQTLSRTWNPALLEYWLRHFRYKGKGQGKVMPEAFGASENPCVVVRSAAVSQTVLEKTKPDATCGRA